jgi:hypothetical protein
LTLEEQIIFIASEKFRLELLRTAQGALGNAWQARETVDTCLAEIVERIKRRGRLENAEWYVRKAVRSQALINRNRNWRKKGDMRRPAAGKCTLSDLEVRTQGRP